ncbi:hypothetical protein BJ546DRAFT_949815 [Cryomyces antarcticus]
MRLPYLSLPIAVLTTLFIASALCAALSVSPTTTRTIMTSGNHTGTAAITSTGKASQGRVIYDPRTFPIITDNGCGRNPETGVLYEFRECVEMRRETLAEKGMRTG